MRHRPRLFLPLAGLALLAACGGPKSGEEQVQEALKEVNVVDETNLNDVMMTMADPDEAVKYFRRASGNDPGRIDLQRGLAKSLVRADRPTEAVSVWKEIASRPGATETDTVALADALLRANRWEEAEAALDSVPPTYETFRRYKLEAMVADANKEWTRADSFYETAVGLTTTPASTYNNWGYSKLSRGAPAEAERLFEEALRNDPQLFTAKNNLVLARGAQRDYDLPVVEMTQTERAQLLHTMALSAIKQGDVNIGKGLLREAIDTHPQYFEEAVRSLRALESNVTN